MVKPYVLLYLGSRVWPKFTCRKELPKNHNTTRKVTFFQHFRWQRFHFPSADFLSAESLFGKIYENCKFSSLERSFQIRITWSERFATWTFRGSNDILWYLDFPWSRKNVICDLQIFCGGGAVTSNREKKYDILQLNKKCAHSTTHWVQTASVIKSIATFVEE
jgi:hypothetical protein